MLSKASLKPRPTVLWCYKKELGFNSNPKKRAREMKKNASVRENPFELFLASSQIRFCYYNETDKILGNTYGMCILQDFEAITPNLLARTIETVEGGGAIVLLLPSMRSLKALYRLGMDIHRKFAADRDTDVVARFNMRFVLSLSGCPTCLVLNDELDVLPTSINTKPIEPAAVPMGEVCCSVIPCTTPPAPARNFPAAPPRFSSQCASQCCAGRKSPPFRQRQ